MTALLLLALGMILAAVGAWLRTGRAWTAVVVVAICMLVALYAGLIP